MFDHGLGQGKDMREWGWKGKMIVGLLPFQFLMPDEDEEFWHEGLFSLNDAKWNRGLYLRWIFFFFFKEKFGTDMRNFRKSVRSGPKGSFYYSS